MRHRGGTIRAGCVEDVEASRSPDASIPKEYSIEYCAQDTVTLLQIHPFLICQHTLQMPGQTVRGHGSGGGRGGAAGGRGRGGNSYFVVVLRVVCIRVGKRNRLTKLSKRNYFERS